MAQTKKEKPVKRIVAWFGGILICLILLGVLLFVLQLQFMVEEDRRAWPRGVVYQMAKSCGSYFKEDGKTDRCVLQNFRIAYSNDIPPDSCSSKEYFRYSVKDLGDSKVSFISTRCTQGGKASCGRKPYHITLTVDYKCGTNFECANWSSDY
jgi:hypothetical protein